MIYQKLINFTNQMKDISFIWWIDWAIWYIITVILANLKADFELFDNEWNVMEKARIRLMNELARLILRFNWRMKLNGKNQWNDFIYYNFRNEFKS